jgi:hypothetical protein
VQDQGRNQGMVGTCKTKEEGMVVSPLDLWNHWGVQILLLLSLCLQVLLHPLIGVRRRSASNLQRGLLLLAYHLASSTAIFAMEHLTLINDPSQDCRLTAFWVTFLLLHQGGPDSIGPPTVPRVQWPYRNLANPALDHGEGGRRERV